VLGEGIGGRREDGDRLDARRLSAGHASLVGDEHGKANPARSLQAGHEVVGIP
jgi:hypothetical protein